MDGKKIETKNVDYEILEGRAFAVLYRKSEDSKTNPCPFCGKSHTHGEGDGHRQTHCIDGVDIIKAQDGTLLFREHGIILKTTGLKGYLETKKERQ